MANITVNYQEIEGAAAQLGAGKEEITLQLQRLQQQIQQLVSGGFVTDHASARFAESYRTFTASAQTAIGQLAEIQSFLTGTSNAIRDLDTRIAAQIR